MKEFKVGDWVITKAGYTKQISGLTRDAYDTLSIGNTSVGVNVVFKNEIELWQPKEGEWCWSKKRNELTNNVCELIRFYWDNDNIGDCEPFIGELPTFLKDK